MRWLFYILVLATQVPLEYSVGPVQLSAARLAFIPFVIGGILSFFNPRSPEEAVAPVVESRLADVLPLVLLLLYGLGLLLFKPFKTRILIDSLELLQIIVAYFVLFYVMGDRHLSQVDARSITAILFVISLIGCGIIIYGYATTTSYEQFRFFRRVTLGSPMFAMGVAFICWLRLKRFAYLVAFCVALSAIVLQLTRGTWLSVVFVLAVMAVLQYRALPIRRFLLLTLYLVTITVCLWILLDVRISRLDPVFSRAETLRTGGANLNARFTNWETSWNIWREHPEGTGLGTWRYYATHFEPYRSYVLSRFGDLARAEVMSPHNDWFTLLVEAGLVGVIAYLWFWIRLGRQVLFRVGRSTYGLIFWWGILAWFTSSLTSDALLGGGGILLVIYLYLYTLSEGTLEGGLARQPATPAESITVPSLPVWTQTGARQDSSWS